MNDPSKKQLLVFRFSSLGDVAMTVPVIRQVLDQHPILYITLVTDNKFAPLFDGLPRFQFYGIDLRGKEKRIGGLCRLFTQLKTAKKFNAIIDLHDVIRTKLLSYLFRLNGYSVFTINKGREEKELLTRRKNKRMVQLPTTFERYANVFSDAGFPVKLDKDAGVNDKNEETHPDIFPVDQNKINIGLAPFAKHREKMYPLEKMERVLDWLSKNDFRIFLLGGGGQEKSILDNWEAKYPRVLSVAGRYSFGKELQIISHLDLMISMDSANMHLASLYGVPVISIWGATHPFVGFLGYGQDSSNIIQVDLECRPCSVFGNKTCFRGDWACMEMIEPETIIRNIQESFGEHN